MKTLRKIGVILMNTAIIACISLLLFEVVYRYQWVDFYQNEWNFHNSKIQKKNNRILIIGDSFSADPNGYVKMLRDTLKDESIYNGSVSGFGPETFRLLINDRLTETGAQHVIIQLYVGNDLYDYCKPVNWKEHSFSRNVFWGLSNYFRSIAFLNYRLGQSSVEDYETVDPKSSAEFDIKLFSPRTKLYITGDSLYPQSAILLNSNNDFEKIVEYLKEMKSSVDSQASFSVLVIPHCIQVNDRYRKRFEMLGAKFDESLVGNNKWVELLSAEGFQIIDPLPEFILNEQEGKQLYFSNDIHLNEEGSEVLMNVVLNEIEDDL